MFDHRSPLILAAAPAGLALGGALWLAVGIHSPTLARLDGYQARLAAVRAPGDDVNAVADLVRAASAPVLALTDSGDGAVRAQGVAITPTLSAALISIGGKPAEWLDVGASRDGVTLVAVQASQITVDTAGGRRDIRIGPAGDAAAARAATFSTTPSQLPSPPSATNSDAQPPEATGPRGITRAPAAGPALASGQPLIMGHTVRNGPQ
ncbi:MAG TPA: hypothetical protein VMU59_12655 [Caulobacteraceae bacterium]|nr:hypothetical protein [Caulobacteraceae bacterium]